MNRVLLHDPSRDRWLRFSQPVRVVRAFKLADVYPAICSVESAVINDSLWAAGFVSYEASSGFDAAMASRAPIANQPLVWFGLFDRPDVLGSLPLRPLAFELGDWTPSITKSAYIRSIERIKEHIREGNTYQVNFTFPLTADFSGSPEALLHRLLRTQPGGYAALIETDAFAAVSVSPELFFRLDGTTLVSRPMKGTRPRGVNSAHDEAQRMDLVSSTKERAENLMIVDMIRNDLSRIAAPGSVDVPVMFATETYPTVIQMTSTVSGQTSAPWSQIMASLFPCASITGAPKIRTTQIIKELEAGARGLYTGSIGYLAPDRKSQFNVAIRTVQIDVAGGQARYDVGGGIVWDSIAEDEYDECRTKSAVLARADPPFSLLETMRYEPDNGILLRHRHLARLKSSATYFGFRVDVEEISRRLDGFSSLETSRLRLLVTRNGRISLESTPMAEASSNPVRLAVARLPIDPADRFLYHKTTHRAVYEARLNEIDEDESADDVVLHTPDGFVTETCTANIAVREAGGRLVTPRVQTGLLAGVLRSELMAGARLHERDVTLDELRSDREIFVLSALRGMRRAVLRQGPG